jgi:hypothetical protein
MVRACSLGAAASLLLVAGSSFAASRDYTFTPVDYPGAIFTAISAVNNHGQVAGSFGGANGVSHAFHGHPGHLEPVDPDGIVGKSAFSAAYGVNNVGAIAGSYSDNPALGRGDHGYLWLAGTVFPVLYPGDMPTEVYAVNDFGAAVGSYFAPDGSAHGYRLENGSFRAEDVPGALSTFPLSINDWGQIVGVYTTAAGTHGYLLEPNGAIRTFDAPGAAPDSTSLIYVNDRDETLGTYVAGSGATVSFLRTCDALSILVAPPSFAATSYSPQAINDLGELAGFFTDATGALHGFIAVPTER